MAKVKHQKNLETILQFIEEIKHNADEKDFQMSLGIYEKIKTLDRLSKLMNKLYHDFNEFKNKIKHENIIHGEMVDIHICLKDSFDTLMTLYYNQIENLTKHPRISVIDGCFLCEI